jgi:hypothetical protein
MSTSYQGNRRGRRAPEEEEDSFGSLPDDELLAMVSAGGFDAVESCEAVEDVLRRRLTCPDAIPLMRDLLFGFEHSAVRYRAALCLARMDEWDADIHRALCHAVAKLPTDDPNARSARLQLQKRQLSPAEPPPRPLVGSNGFQAPAAKAVEPAPPPPTPTPPPQPAAPKPVHQPAAAASPAMVSLPRYTMEDVEEPRIRYRRRKRKRGELRRQIFANLQILLLFIVAFLLYLAFLART